MGVVIHVDFQQSRVQDPPRESQLELISYIEEQLEWLTFEVELARQALEYPDSPIEEIVFDKESIIQSVLQSVATLHRKAVLAAP